jgi:tight adherence protein C
MNLAPVLGVGVGIGLVGAVVGLTPQKRSLGAILRTLEGEPKDERQAERQRAEEGRHSNVSMRSVSRRWTVSCALRLLGRHPAFVRALQRDLLTTSSTIEGVTERVVFACASGALAPIVCWVALSLLGMAVPPPIPVSLAVIAGLCGALLPIIVLRKNANRVRRHARTMVGSYLDLVVLGLAGGLGIEGALHTAALICETPISQRLVRAMDEARDAGGTPWSALAVLGRELGVSELEELAVAVSLAGTEGARIRSTLAAKAASIRNHELADAETEANTVSERLFLPGVFMLLGFLIFIGYPAVTRLTTGL